ncbi:MAG: hypothetical protein ABFS09_03175 [Thermodesulfobacteriota bacterium]
MNTLSKIAAGTAGFALVALLSMPIAGAAGGDGTGPAPGTTGGQMMEQDANNNAPCYGPGQGRGHHWRGHFRNCNGPGQGKGQHHRGHGPGQGRGGFVDKDGDGICDFHPDSGKGGEPAKL